MLGLCCDCRRFCPLYGNGQCRQCWWAKRPRCTLCRIRVAVTKGRLCKKCAANESDLGPSEAELDALIAEQMKCLPPWWNEDKRKMQFRNPGWVVPLIRDPRPRR